MNKEYELIEIEIIDFSTLDVMTDDIIPTSGEAGGDVTEEDYA